VGIVKSGVSKEHIMTEYKLVVVGGRLPVAPITAALGVAVRCRPVSPLTVDNVCRPRRVPTCDLPRPWVGILETNSSQCPELARVRVAMWRPASFAWFCRTYARSTNAEPSDPLLLPPAPTCHPPPAFPEQARATLGE